jgi:hypothetical protein
MIFYLLLLFVIYKITNSKNETSLFLNGKNLDKLQSEPFAVSLFNNTTNISSFYPKTVIALFEQPLVYQITISNYSYSDTNYSVTDTVVIKDENTNEIPNNKLSVKPIKRCQTRRCKRNKRRKRNSFLAYTMAAAIILL